MKILKGVDIDIKSANSSVKSQKKILDNNLNEVKSNIYNNS